MAARDGSRNTTRVKEVAPLEDNQEPLMTPGEVAKLFRVDPRTVTRWAKAGKLTSIRTIGGMRRFSRREVMQLINASRTDRVT